MSGVGSSQEGEEPFLFEGSGGSKRFAPATQRNRDAIAGILRTALPPKGLVLEIASGTGEHIVHFARAFPHLQWQPSDPDPAALASIAAWRAEAALPNLSPPLRLDAADEWPIANANAILCVNMVHISPWEATAGLMRGAARILAPGAPLYLYGPYRQRGMPTAPSNEEFDRSLRSRNPAWGLRYVEDVANLATGEGLALLSVTRMPANNLSLLFQSAG